MTTQKEIMANLETILVPRITRDLVKMNLVRDVSITNGKVKVTLSSAALAPGAPSGAGAAQGWDGRVDDAVWWQSATRTKVFSCGLAKS